MSYNLFSDVSDIYNIIQTNGNGHDAFSLEPNATYTGVTISQKGSAFIHHHIYIYCKSRTLIVSK